MWAAPFLLISQPPGRERPARSGLEIALERGRYARIDEVMGREDPPRLEFRGMRRLTRVVGGEPLINVGAEAV